MIALEFVKPEKRPHGKGKVHTKYTNDYRRKLINMALDNGNASQVARECGVNIKTLHGWIARANNIL